jgi:nucleoid-associated protein YgaU
MPLEKAVITNTVTGERIPVMFNPEEYSVNKENNFAQVAVPGLRSPLIQFVHGNLKTLEMELFLDTYEQHVEGSRVLNSAGEDVRNLTRKVSGLLDIDPSTHAPPVLLFTWGSLSLRCVLSRVTQRFILFKPDGTPVRARLQVTFSEFTNAELEARETKRETADYSKLYVAKQGETLDVVAWRVYCNAALWRAIALHNDIDDPRMLPPGLRLLIPQLPYRDPETGEVFQ